MSSGKIGEKIVKKTGQIESKVKRVKNVRGCHYTKVVIDQTIQRIQVLCSTCNINERKKILKQLTLKDNQLSKAREDETIKRYAAILSDVIGANRNVVQSQSGFDTTSHMKGEITYSKLGTKHVSLV